MTPAVNVFVWFLFSDAAVFGSYKMLAQANKVYDVQDQDRV